MRKLLYRHEIAGVLGMSEAECAKIMALPSFPKQLSRHRWRREDIEKFWSERKQMKREVQRAGIYV